MYAVPLKSLVIIFEIVTLINNFRTTAYIALHFALHQLLNRNILSTSAYCEPLNIIPLGCNRSRLILESLSSMANHLHLSVNVLQMTTVHLLNT